jgi:uncharacterized protein (TIGR00251 family)
MGEPFEDRPGCVRIRIRAQPRASRSEVVGLHGDELKVRLAAPPVDGAANEELVRFVARTLRTAASRVRLVGGESSRSKVLEIDGFDSATVRATLLG